MSLPIPLILYKLLYREVNLICNAPFGHFWSGVLHFRFGALFTPNLALVFSFKVLVLIVSEETNEQTNGRITNMKIVNEL